MSEPESPTQSITRRPMWHEADNCGLTPVVMVGPSVMVDGVGYTVSIWPDNAILNPPASRLSRAADLGEWARRWRECGGPIVDVLPWASDEGEGIDEYDEDREFGIEGAQ